MKVRHHLSTAWRGSPVNGLISQYRVHFFTQPFWRYRLAKAYHRYHTHWLVEAIVHHIDAELQWGDRPDLVAPLSNAQDIRCHELCQAGRTYLARVEIDKENYDRLRLARRRRVVRRLAGADGQDTEGPGTVAVSPEGR